MVQSSLVRLGCSHQGSQPQVHQSHLAPLCLHFPHRLQIHLPSLVLFKFLMHLLLDGILIWFRYHKHQRLHWLFFDHCHVCLVCHYHSISLALEFPQDPCSFVLSPIMIGELLVHSRDKYYVYTIVLCVGLPQGHLCPTRVWQTPDSLELGCLLCYHVKCFFDVFQSSLSQLLVCLLNSFCLSSLLIFFCLSLLHSR